MDLSIPQEASQRKLVASYSLAVSLVSLASSDDFCSLYFYSYNGMRKVDGKRGCRAPQGHGLKQTGFLGFAHRDR